MRLKFKRDGGNSQNENMMRIEKKKRIPVCTEIRMTNLFSGFYFLLASFVSELSFLLLFPDDSDFVFPLEVLASLF
jgi:hypothetical protein